MAVIHTESWAWSNVTADYANLKGYGPVGPTGWGTSAPPYTGATYAGVGTQNNPFEGGWTPPYATNRLITGMYQTSQTPASGNWRYFGASVGGQHTSVGANGSGQLVLIDVGGNVQYTSPGVIFPNPTTWHFIEVDWNLSAGNTILRIDGVAVFTYTGVVSGNITNFDLAGGGTGGAGPNYGPWYVIDPRVGANTTFLGPVHINCRLPNAAGSTTQWSHVGAASNVAAVADTPAPDYSTTYVATTTVGNRDFYGVPALAEAAPTAVPAVATYVIATKDDVAKRGIKASLSSGGTIQDGSEVLLNTVISPQFVAWQVAKVIADVDPNTGSPWTIGAANAIQVGQVLSS